MAAPDFSEREHARAFGDRLRALRAERGLTQEGLAEVAGTDRSHLADIERGAGNPTLAVIHRLATALDVPAAELFR